MKKKTPLLLAVLFAAFTVKAQTTFQKTYGGLNDDVAYSVQQTSDGGYIIAGSTASFGAGYDDVYLIKTNALGDTLWTKVIGEGNTEWAYSVQQTSDGGYIVGGWGGFNLLGVFYMIKTDSNGNVVWSKRYASGAYDSVGTFAQQTNDGGYVITGYSWNYSTSDEDILLIKTDNTGNVLWSKSFGTQVYDEPFCVLETPDGGLAVFGYNFDFATGYEFFLIKTNSSGNFLWSKSYGGTAMDQGLSFNLTSDGGFILTGQSNSFGPNSSYTCLIKTDSSGNMQWTRRYNITNVDVPFSVGQTSDGGYFIGGTAGNTIAGTENIFLMRTDAAGNIIWSNSYGSTGADGAFSAGQTIDGGFIIAGYTTSFGAGNKDFYLIKTDASGNSGCYTSNVVVIDSVPPMQMVTPIATVISPTVPFAATSTFSASGSSVNPLCLITGNPAIEASENIFSFSPNPVTSELRIYNSEFKIERIEIYDILAQKVLTQQATNEKQQSINISSLTSGIYFVKVRNEKEERVAKFVKQ